MRRSRTTIPNSASRTLRRPGNSFNGIRKYLCAKGWHARSNTFIDCCRLHTRFPRHRHCHHVLVDRDRCFPMSRAPRAARVRAARRERHTPAPQARIGLCAPAIMRRPTWLPSSTRHIHSYERGSAGARCYAPTFPAQREDFTARRHFDVAGGMSGQRCSEPKQPAT